MAMIVLVVNRAEGPLGTTFESTAGCISESNNSEIEGSVSVTNVMGLY